MSRELRCNGTMHGRLLDGGILEVKCRRRGCGHDEDTIVLHHFSIHTGELLDTKRFADPKKHRR